MIYATKADIEEIWGAGFLADILPEDVDAEAAVAAALKRASEVIDLHLSARYELPLATLPPGLVGPAADIAVYLLANRHAVLTTTMEDRHKDAVDLLGRIGTGRAGLGVAEPRVSTDGDADAAAGSGAAFSANPRRFTRGTP